MGIGPSTKETSLHHFRDPLLDVVSKDTDVDLMGVMLVGSPDGNEERFLHRPLRSPLRRKPHRGMPASHGQRQVTAQLHMGYI